MSTNNVLANLLAAAAKRKAEKALQTQVISIAPIAESLNSHLYYDAEKGITYNEKQTQALQYGKDGKSFVLIGAAGTGKTTCMKGVLNALVQSGVIPQYHNDGHKHLGHATHGLIISAFTRRAVANIKKNMSYDMQGSCITVHAALEYAPEFFEVEDPITGDMRKTMKFIPTRNSYRPISDSIKFCIIEESSMLGVDLFKELQDALPADCKFIFLGDIQQLPPVFGSAILGFKMLELPVVELTEVYRQALESPIISLAHRILSGVEMPVSELMDWNAKYSSKGLQFHPIKKRVHAEHILPKIANFFKKEIIEGKFDTEQDTILIPFNKGLGTIELNKEIAQFLTERRKSHTYEIIAGFNKHYYSPGDKVLFEKEDAVILSINSNANYAGLKFPRKESLGLDRWGYDRESNVDIEGIEADDFDLANVDNVLANLSGSPEETKERKAEASHVITIRMSANGEEISLSKAAEINALLLGYALTVHKSQGSEWRKVYCLFHQSHNTMIARELLYTAVTRAREELYIICEPDTFMKGISRQKVPGNTIAEKAEHFKGKIEKGDY